MKSFKRFLKEKEDYVGEHGAPDPESGAHMHDLTHNGVYPDDVYSHKGFDYHNYGGGSNDYKAHEIAMSAHGRPHKEVKVYRSVPKDVENAKINKGDWVATTRKYAKDHGESVHGKDNYKILSKTVTAKDLFTDGNSIHEWGYHPQHQDFDTRASYRKEQRLKANETRAKFGYGPLKPDIAEKMDDDFRARREKVK